MASQEFISQVRDSRIEGKYGDDPRVESVTLLRNDLYRKAEGAVKLWITDTRFSTRFILSSLVFLVGYFFFTYVVRTPFPFVYKLALAVLTSVGTYYWLGMKYLNSDAVIEKRVDLRTVIDGIAFAESEFMKKAERLLAHYDEAKLEELLNVYGDHEKGVLDPAWLDEARSLKVYLGRHFDTKAMKNFDRLLQKKVTIEAVKPLEKMQKLIEVSKVDFPLYLLYIWLKKSV